MTDGELGAAGTGRSRRCRVVVMPDSFGGTLDAAAAAAAIGAGWQTGRPHDAVVLAPQSDGGPGFVEVLAASLGGEHRNLTVEGPLGDPVGASWLRRDATAYVEASQACGLHLLPEPPDPHSARSASTAGVGELISAAVAAGCRRIVVGLGGSATTDGGRGAADRLGGLAAARQLLRDVDLVVATDVDNPLLGPGGAAAVFGPQKGADAATVARLEERLAGWADHLEATAGLDLRDEPGAGAAGGLGAFLLACGGRRTSGAQLVAAETHRRDQIAAADLVITGEGRIDAQTFRGKLVAVVADEAAAAAVPVLVLAGQSLLTAAESAAVGEVHSLVHHAGSLATAMTDAGPQLTDLAARLAARWAGPGGVALGE